MTKELRMSLSTSRLIAGVALASALTGCVADADHQSQTAAVSRSSSPTICLRTDRPDDDFIDSNCDGIDGDIGAAVFVSPLGDDGNPGTISEPVRSIHRGSERAMERGLTSVYVAAGHYTEFAPIEVEDGISIYGGYQPDWTRDGTRPWIVRQHVPGEAVFAGVHANGIFATTTLDSLTFLLLPTQGVRAVVGIDARSAPGLHLHRVSVSASAGPDGAPGAPSPASAAGQNGRAGRGGCKEIWNPPAGGLGGASCGSTGGRGGRFGVTSRSAATAGTGPGGGMPGRFVGVLPGGRGGDASLNLAIARHGDGGEAGRRGRPGRNGATGSAGGGGEAGGLNPFSAWAGAGAGGGGGGAGGCGGFGGEGGSAGASSIALLTRSIGSVTDCFFVASDGGDGGAGGRGGAGGNGGLGGPGGNGGSFCLNGGSGGNGAAGATGGNGGGGGGGLSVAVLAVDSSLTEAELIAAGNTMRFTRGGAGGSPPPGLVGRSGAPGIAAAFSNDEIDAF